MIKGPLQAGVGCGAAVSQARLLLRRRGRRAARRAARVRAAQTWPCRPAKAADRVLLATWNLANLGVEQRRDKDDQLIAKLVGWFDLVALREVRRRRHRAPVGLQDQAGVPRLRPTTTSLTTGRCGRSSRPQP
jgi:hypothetical protein